MDNANSVTVMGDGSERVLDPFPSLSMLKAVHTALLRRRHRKEEGSQFWADVANFIYRGKATGALLDLGRERWAIQSLLDYWASALYRSRQKQSDAVLSKFDSALVDQYVRCFDGFYERLSSNERGKVRHILLCLVQSDEEQTVNCRNVSLAELRRRIGGMPEDTDQILDKLAQAGILCRVESDRTGEEQVEVAYGSVMRHWSRLATWLQDKDLLILTETVEYWASRGRDPQDLFSGERLGQVLRYQDLNDQETEFVEASVVECLSNGDGIDPDIANTQLIQILAGLFSHQERIVRSRAEHALERIAARRPDLALPAIEGLMELLTGSSGPIRGRAAKILEEVVRVRLEDVTTPTVDTLLGLLGDPDLEVSRGVEDILKRIAVGRRELAPHLVEALGGRLADPSAAARAGAARTIEAILVAHPEWATLQMAEELTGLLRDSDSPVRSSVRCALEQVLISKPDVALRVAELLDDLLADADSEIRAHATRALAKAVRADRRAATVPRAEMMLELLEDPELGVQSQAKYARKQMAVADPQLFSQVWVLGPQSTSFVHP